MSNEFVRAVVFVASAGSTITCGKKRLPAIMRIMRAKALPVVGDYRVAVSMRAYV
ncbi:MAG TPA: hypothetical protein VFB80_06755 [Pirellulaceae bacterium]|nr:hypothetical protein [Pirellulaceae bacterium]